MVCTYEDRGTNLCKEKKRKGKDERVYLWSLAMFWMGIAKVSPGYRQFWPILALHVRNSV